MVNIIRGRLVERLRPRFVTGRIVVSAGAGFGKSRLVDQALADNRVRPAGLDLRVDLDGRLRSEVAFTDAVLRAARLMPTGDVDHDVHRLLAWLVAQSPLDICLVFDDLHELDGSPAADLLAQLAETLPVNAHLLLVGRDLSSWVVPSPHSTESGVVLSEADLVFSPDEIDAIARSESMDPERLAVFGGWPALTAAIALGRPSMAVDFALEEVFEQLAPDAQRAVAALGVARRLPIDVVAGLMSALSVDDLVARVPLVEARDGDVIGHDLWRGVAPRSLGGSVAAALVAALIEHRRFETAVEVAQRCGRWDDADVAVLGLVASRMHGIPIELCRRLTDDVPPAHRHRTGHRLLEAIARSHERDPRGSDDHGVTELLALADDVGADGSAAASTVLGVAVAIAWIARDPVAIDTVARRVGQTGLDPDDWLVLVAQGFADLVHGRVADAERRLRRANDLPLPREAQSLVVRVLVTLLGVSGDIAALRAVDLEVLRSSPDSHVRQAPMVVAWLSGDVDGVVPWRTMVPDGDRHRSDQLTQLFFHAAVRASWGDTADLALFADMVLDGAIDDHGAIACRRALIAAVVHVGLGDAATAAQLLAEAGARDDVSAGSLPLQELARALCYPYVLVPELRPLLDALEHGLHRRHRAIARWLIELRGGQLPEEPFPSPSEIFLALPLQWSCELARRAVDARVDGAAELAHWLRTHVGPQAVALLAGEAVEQAEHAEAGEGAASGRGGRPASGGADDVRLVLFGPPRIEHGSHHLAAAAAPEWRRQRVRQLLAIMTLRRRITRTELATWLWPDRSEQRARANLRVTLTYARRVVGDHEVASARRVLLDSDGVLELVPHRRFSVDLWEHQAALAEAKRCEAIGEVDQAVTALERALALWVGRPLVDLDYDDRAAPDLAALRNDLCRTGTRCAELRLAHGDSNGSAAALEAVLDLDPAWAPAHRAAIAVAVRSGDEAAVARAVERSRSALEGFGHDPGPSMQITRNLAALDVAPRPTREVGTLARRLRVDVALDERWTHRLVEFVAPRSAGKSQALVRAMAAWSGSDLHIDVPLAGLDRDPSETLAAAANALGSGFEQAGETGRAVSIAEGVAALAAAVAARAPAQVCLVADGVESVPAASAHEVSGVGGGTVEALRMLVRALPPKGHVLVATRRPLDLHTARLELVGSVARIDAGVLTLDPDEQKALVPSRARTIVAACNGWAGAGYAARSGGRVAALGALRSAFAELAPDVAAAVAVAARLDGVDGEALRTCDLGIDVDDVAAEAPMVRCEDGRIEMGPGAWALLRDEVLDEATVVATNARAAELEERSGRPTQALAMLLEGSPVPATTDAEGAIAGLVARAHLAALDPLARDWEQLRAALSEAHPAAAIAEAVIAHHDGRAAATEAALDRAVAAGLDRALARIHRLHLAWCLGDRATLAAIAAPASADHGADPEEVAIAVALLARAAITAADGHHQAALVDLDDAVARTSSSTSAAAPALVVQADLQRQVSLAAAGFRPDRVRARTARSADPTGPARELRWIPPVQWVGATTAWFVGELDPLAALLTAVDGDLAQVPAGCRVLVAEAAASIDPAAPAPAETGDDRRWPVPWAPLQQLHAASGERRRALDARNPSASASPSKIDLSVPERLTDPTSRDLVIATRPIGQTLDLVGAIIEESPDTAVAVLDRLAALCPAGLGRAASTPADARLALAFHTYDRTVSAPVEVELLADPPALTHGGRVIVDGHWRRPQVRRLAALLAIGSWTREQVVAELWPDASATSGMRSLRVALHYLRDALDPERPDGARSLLVASATDATRLVPLPGFSVDLWDIVDGLEAAETQRGAGRHADAAATVHRAASCWRSAGAEITAVEPVSRHLDRLRARLLAALCEAGDTLAGLGEVDAVVDLGNQVVTLDPWCQHGYRLMIAAHLAAGRTVTARSVLDLCRQVLDEAGVALSPETRTLAKVLERTVGHDAS